MSARDVPVSELFDELKKANLRAVEAEAKLEPMREAIKDAIDTLETTGCVFWACDGPEEPFVAMKTCKVCSTIQDLRDALIGGAV